MGRHEATFRVGNNPITGKLNLERMNNLHHMAMLSQIAFQFNTCQRVRGGENLDSIYLDIWWEDDTGLLLKDISAAGFDYSVYETHEGNKLYAIVFEGRTDEH